MKHIYNPLNTLKLFLLFFPFMISSSEYHYATDHTPTVKMNVDIAQSRPTSPFQSSSRNRRLNYMMQNIPKNTSQHVHCSTNTITPLPQSISALHYVHNAFQAQRREIIEQFTHNDPNMLARYFQKYFIPEISKKYLASHNIDINTFESCEGNILQHTIHQELIVLTDTTAHLWNEQSDSLEIQNLTTVIADFASAGSSFNHLGEITKAMALVDAGWAILDCIQAAGEGVVEGISSIGHTIIHPIEAAQHFAQTVTTCGYYLGVALQEIDCVTEAIIRGQFDVAHSRYTVWSEHCKNIAQVLNEQCKELALRDVIKTVARSAVESYATTRALNGFSNFFQHAHQSAALIAKKISNGAQESTLLMSAEGIPVRIAQETLTQAKKLPRANDKLLQMLSKFEAQKITVGKITCVLDKKGIKHILERHHPLYWNGSLKGTQTFLNKNTTIPEIVRIIKQVIKQNRKTILAQGTTRKYQIDGLVKNISYKIGFDNGRIGQFYIPLTQ